MCVLPTGACSPDLGLITVIWGEFCTSQRYDSPANLCFQLSQISPWEAACCSFPVVLVNGNVYGCLANQECSRASWAVNLLSGSCTKSLEIRFLALEEMLIQAKASNASFPLRVALASSLQSFCSRSPPSNGRLPFKNSNKIIPAFHRSTALGVLIRTDFFARPKSTILTLAKSWSSCRRTLAGFKSYKSLCVTLFSWRYLMPSKSLENKSWASASV